MKYIILIGDGMGDFPLDELGGRTPLEAASTPAMDYLAAHGELLVVRTIPRGMAPGSDVANLSLLGYRPEQCYSGRAPLEAASMGVDLAEGEIAFRCNLVTLDFEADGRIIMNDYSAGHISTAEAGELIHLLQDSLGDNTIRFYPGVSYRHLMVHKGELVGLETVPPHDHSGRDVSVHYNQYMAHAHLREMLHNARGLLSAHPVNQARTAAGKKPANAIWLWGEGRPPAMATIRDRFGVGGGLISAVDLVKGIGVYAGLDIITVPGATGYLDTNYEGKANAALDALRKDDFVFVHVEAPDEAGHQGLVREKLQAIEDFDRRVVQVVLDGLVGGPDYRLLVGMDHLTPISMRTHADLPVPVILFDSRQKKRSGSQSFSEAEANRHGTSIENGEAMFLKLLDRP